VSQAGGLDASSNQRPCCRTIGKNAMRELDCTVQRSLSLPAVCNAVSMVAKSPQAKSRGLDRRLACSGRCCSNRGQTSGQGAYDHAAVVGRNRAPTFRCNTGILLIAVTEVLARRESLPSEHDLSKSRHPKFWLPRKSFDCCRSLVFAEQVRRAAEQPCQTAYSDL